MADPVRGPASQRTLDGGLVVNVEMYDEYGVRPPKVVGPVTLPGLPRKDDVVQLRGGDRITVDHVRWEADPPQVVVVGDRC